MYQQAVDLLEHYKRRLGRQYDRELRTDRAQAMHTLYEYNATEDCISSLVSVHNLTRKSKPYKLEV